jgi:hypothetical protein
MGKNFLHDHPRMQYILGVDDKHVIVDKEDWQLIQIENNIKNNCEVSNQFKIELTIITNGILTDLQKIEIRDNILARLEGYKTNPPKTLNEISIKIL